jgi:hypothetical protein
VGKALHEETSSRLAQPESQQYQQVSVLKYGWMLQQGLDGAAALVALVIPSFPYKVMNCFFSPANFNFLPLNFKFSPHPPLFSPHPPIFSPLRYVRSRQTISCELGGCSHFAPRMTQIKTSGDALGQPNSNGWRKTGSWHAPDGTYTAVTGAIRVSVGPLCRNPSLLGRYSKHKNNN